MRNQIDDLQYELGKVRYRNDKLENHLAEAIEKLKTLLQMHGTNEIDKTAAALPGNNKANPMTSVAAQHLEDLQKELEEYRELSNNRLQELDKLHSQHREALKDVERLKMDVSRVQILKLKHGNNIALNISRFVNCLNLLLSKLRNINVYNPSFLSCTMNQCK